MAVGAGNYLWDLIWVKKKWIENLIIFKHVVLKSLLYGWILEIFKFKRVYSMYNDNKNADI